MNRGSKLLSIHTASGNHSAVSRNNSQFYKGSIVAFQKCSLIKDLAAGLTSIGHLKLPSADFKRLTHFFMFSLLASGSDDQHAIIWDPFRHKKLTTMHTGHAANIFSVKVRRPWCDRCLRINTFDILQPYLNSSELY